MNNESQPSLLSYIVNKVMCYGLLCVCVCVCVCACACLCVWDTMDMSWSIIVCVEEESNITETYHTTLSVFWGITFIQ